MSAGGRLNEIDQHEHRITAIEAKSDARDENLNVIDVRTAQIETKRNVLVPSAGDKVALK